MASQTLSFSYDALGRQRTESGPLGTVRSSYDAGGRRNMLIYPDRSTVDQSRLQSASQIASRTVSNDAYAAAVTNASQSDSHNGLNQITATGGAGIGHDAKGNMTSDPSVPMTYGYSSENLLTSAPGPYGNGTLTYDPLMRLWDSGTGGRTRVLHDGEQRITEYNVAGTPSSRFVFGPGIDEPLIRYTGSDLVNRRFLYGDERGSIVGEADGAGTSTGVGTFDDYGQSLTFAGGRFAYAGQPYETVSDLQYPRARFYNARRGRFMQPDPIGYGDGMNLYAYVGGDPVNFVDPFGTQQEATEIVVNGRRPSTLDAIDLGYGLMRGVVGGGWYPRSGAQQPEEIVVNGARLPEECEDEPIVVTGRRLRLAAVPPPPRPPIIPLPRPPVRKPLFPRDPDCMELGWACLQHNPSGAASRTNCAQLENICNAAKGSSNDRDDVYRDYCVGPACLVVWGRHVFWQVRR